MAGLRAELDGLLGALEARISAFPRGYFYHRGEAEWWFCLALAYRRHAIKPVERLAARIQWAKMSAAQLDRVDWLLKNRPDEGLPERSRSRRLISRRL